MPGSLFSAVKLQTVDPGACEAFFRDVFGFQVTHRYARRHTTAAALLKSS